MPLNVNIIGRDSEGNPRVLKVNSEGNLEISDSLGWGDSLQDISDKLDILVSGTIPVIYISRLEDRPSATEVEIGQFVILTDEELSMWVSNGVNWVEVL